MSADTPANAAADGKPAPDPLAPGSVIGILGGGQLGRMAALAAYPLGYRVHVYTPKADDPATQVTDRATIAGYDDADALAAFARSVDVVTYEFENVPARTAEILGESVPLRPRPQVLAICQDRLKEKDFLRDHGIPTTEYAEVTSQSGLAHALGPKAVGKPAVLKTVRGGYDGKGQVMIGPDTTAETAWAELAGSDAEPVGILEAFVDYALEASVIVARGADGRVDSYVPVENRHDNHILARTIAPAALSPATAKLCTDVAHAVAHAIDLVGVMGVELFVTHDGEVLVNELAPRPHNSGHWTIDACGASQFEQFVRAVAGLPLATFERHSDAVMDNLLGDDAARWLEIARDPDARLHLYGKAEARPGRKMGHVTRLKPRRG